MRARIVAGSVASAAAAVILALAPSCSSSGPAPAGAVVTSEESDPASASFDRRNAVLRGQIRGILEAIARGDDKSARTRAAELALPDASAWMDATFGDAGARLTADYAPLAKELPQLVDALRPFAGAGQVDLSVERFTEADDAAATGYQVAAIAAMARPVPLYSVRLSTTARDAGAPRVYHLWSFVDVDDKFRWIGKLRPLVATPPPAGADPLELRVRDRIAAAPAPLP